MRESKFSRELDLPGLKDLLGTVAGWAGKGKDEVVQVIAREVGTAMAAMLKEPLQKLVDSQKLILTIEFSPKKKELKLAQKKTPKANKKRTRS